jgi:hypothetical protein
MTGESRVSLELLRYDHRLHILLGLGFSCPCWQGKVTAFAKPLQAKTN